MGEYLGIMLLAYGPWFLISAALVTSSVIVGRALNRRNANAATIAALNERIVRLEEEHADAMAALARRETVHEFERQLASTPRRTDA